MTAGAEPDVDRVIARLELLFGLGGGPHANRPGLSAVEEDACLHVSRWMSEAGLRVSWDAIGNLKGERPGTDASAPPIWLGSHLDTVPGGGRFDGALGVVGGLEALATIREPLKATVALWAFRDEEGWRFGRSCFGSRAMTGALEPDELAGRDADGVTVADALAALGRLTELPAPGWLAPAPRAFLELHIEQGPVLASSDAPVGVVSAIAGVSEGIATFRGRRGHAGTTPMNGRADALRAAARFVEQAALVAESLPGAVATVGSLRASPGAQNVIADEVELTVDLRAPEVETLDLLHSALERSVAETAGTLGCDGRLERTVEAPPVTLAPELRRVLADGVAETGLAVVELASGAGHDAAVLAAAGVPTAMLFVRSLADGISHDPAERCAPQDIGAAIEVLRLAVHRLASMRDRP
jgi:allantoate deiminase